MWRRSSIHVAILSLAILCMSTRGTSTIQIPELDFTGQPTYEVVRVSDGDTVYLMMDGESTRVRLIGVDTPETKDPEEPVQRYGPEATTFLTNLLKGEEVYVQREPGMNRGKYDRPLVYLYRAPDGLFVNLEIVRQGYGRVDAPPAFQYIGLFNHYEQRAREIGKGLWAANEDFPKDKKPEPQPDDVTVYVTRAGKKYHCEDCSYLSDSKIRIGLKGAKQRGYTPCSRCKPPDRCKPPE